MIVERRRDPEEAGAGIQISPNASRILADIGLPGLLAAAVAPRRLDIRHFDDPRRYASMPMGDQGGRYDAPFWVVLRADLHRALMERAAREPTLRLAAGATVADVRSDPDGLDVMLDLDNGLRAGLRATAVIGADGLWSTVRRFVLDTTPPRFTRQEAWRAVVPTDGLLPFLKVPAVNLWLANGAHLVNYPVAAGRLVNVVLVRPATAPRDGWSRPGDVAEIEPLAAGMAPELAKLIRAAPAWNVWSLFDRPAAARLAKGRIALVGDAGHPTLPFLAQGAAMAIEDAAVLARLMPPPTAMTGTAVETALAAWSALRTPRVARVQAAARRNAQIYHAGRLMAFARDTVLRRSDGAALLRRYDWLYGWRDA